MGNKEEVGGNFTRRKKNTSKALSWEPNVKRVSNTAPLGSCRLNHSLAPPGDDISLELASRKAVWLIGLKWGTRKPPRITEKITRIIVPAQLHILQNHSNFYLQSRGLHPQSSSQTQTHLQSPWAHRGQTSHPNHTHLVLGKSTT